MTEAEVEIVDLLGECATKFCSLPQEHASDTSEFVAAIHAAQNIVQARAGMRAYRRIKGLHPDWKKPTEGGTP